ncbi:MAG TPA: nucleotidyltransferase domain-containing protein [Candidatus Kapabacteria bacterium]|nr:nucleotidyltransferase domain-containing protein [Candidatus Kapabacteria bacterium]
MKNKEQLQIPMSMVENFCRRWQIREFSIFGSALREDFSSRSDVDVLLSFLENAQWGLFELLDMKDELKKIFGREVDIVEKEGIRNPFRRREILRTRKVIYAT